MTTEVGKRVIHTVTKVATATIDDLRQPRLATDFKKGNTMKQYLTNAYSIESTSQLLEIRQVEFKNQKWNRAKSQLLADGEGICLSDEHWRVLSFLRKQYLKDGLPRHARYLAKSLIQSFTAQGGNKYLRKLFPGGPITQGSRFANLPVPPDAASKSHGSCY